MKISVLLICTQLLFPRLIEGREADERQNFLFVDDPDAQDLIQEYQINLGNIDEYYEALDEHRVAPDEEVHRIPSFLTSNYEFDRVVNFYSPWCAHCQKFKPRFIDLAKKFSESSIEHLEKVEFHAVSCSAHHWLCKASAIQGYPIVRTYRKGSADFQEAKRFTPQAMAAVFGVQLEKVYSSSNNEFQDVELHHYESDVYDVLGAAMDAYRRTKKDVFHDATVSLLFSLQFDVNVDEEGDPPREERLEAFSKWIDLLYWTLPSSWKVNTLINDLRTNNDFKSISNGVITNTVESNKAVVLPDASVLWTDSCQRRSRKSEGYTCGIWSLLHIVTVGVAEQHHAVIGDTEMVSTEYAAISLRAYVNNFLGCKICKKNFNKMYQKKCNNKHKHDEGCNRFKRKKRKRKRIDPRKEPNLDYWRDLTIWMWEIHNEINIEVLKERKRNDNKTDELTKEEVERVIYPSTKNCRQCRKGAKWDHTELYNYLKSQYWPEGVHNFRYVVLKSKHENLKIKKPRRAVNYQTSWQIFGLFISLSITIVGRFYSSDNKKRNSKHKKNDTVRKKPEIKVTQQQMRRFTTSSVLKNSASSRYARSKF